MMRRLALGHLLGLLIAAVAGAVDPGAVLVEPADLARRADLIGHRIAVDDRVRRFQWHKDTELYDEIYLRRTAVVFRLPPRLYFKQAPRAMAIRLEGILKREGEQLVCDVTNLELFPGDLERLEGEAPALSPRDAEGRAALARWAERRGMDFKDEALLDRGRRLEAEALRIEAERPSTDPARQWLALARRGRQRRAAEPEPSALAHRALAGRLVNAEDVDGVQSLLKDVQEFWPDSPRPIAGPAQEPGPENRNPEADLEAWLTPYARDPAAAYRAAPPPVRAALDHRLWADATQRLAELRMAADPGRALEYAQEAAQALPDRPLVGKRLIGEALKTAMRDIAALRQGDVEALAQVYRGTLRQPEAANDLLRRWLDDQRDHRLSSTDAEGRVLLAGRYETMLGDRATAVALLQDAWRIDPQSREVSDAFRRLGFRKVRDQWVESTRAAGPDQESGAGPATGLDPTNSRAAVGAQNSSLRGLTPQEIRVRLGGKPNRIIWSASQGQVLEQWIYHGVNQDQYLNFLHVAGEPEPKVVAHYARPRSRKDSSRPR
jgi:tetratricopeptide (TPR) repeat protein